MSKPRSPRISSSPPSACRNPQASENAVVLPAPFGPISPKNDPRGTSRFRPSSARVAPNRLRTSLNRSAALEAGFPSLA